MRVFFRCNSGHFFATEFCPWDGWSHPGFKSVLECVDKLKLERKSLSIEMLRRSGVQEEVLNRVIIVEFGDPQAALEGIYPKQVVVAGRIREPIDLDRRFK